MLLNLFLTSLTLLLLSFSARAFTLKDLGEEFTSPVKETSKLLVTGGVVAIGALAFRDSHIQTLEDEETHHRRLGDFSSFGDYAGQLIPNALYASYQAYQGFNGDSNGYRRSIGMIKATAYAGLVTTALKYTVRAPRPNDNKVKNSFPSGHSATVFTFAGYVMEEHGAVPGALALTLASFCGYSRIHDHMHRLHEVIAGATIGLAYGISISRTQRKVINMDRESFFGGFSFAPILDMETKGIALFKEF